MPPHTDTPRLADVELTTAQEVPAQLAAAVDALLPILSQQPRDGASTAGWLQIGDLAEIVVYSARLIQELAVDASKPKEAQNKAKSWTMVCCVYAVLVAVSIVEVASVGSVFTFGAGALVGPAIAGVLLPLGAAGSALIDFLKVAERRGHPLAGEAAMSVSQVMTALRDFVNTPLTEGVAARDQALKEISQSLRLLEELTPKIRKIKGSCHGHPRAVFQSCQALGLIVTRLTGSFWFASSDAPTDVQPVAQALESLRHALAQAQPARSHSQQNRSRSV
jgi:hypothetical protein